MILFRTAFYLFVGVALCSAESLIPNSSFEFSSGAPASWNPQGAANFKMSKAEDGIEIEILATSKAFNSVALISSAVSLPKGSYRLSVQLSGDAGAKVFFGPRLSLSSPKDSMGKDLWETLSGNEKSIQGNFSSSEDASMKLIIAFGSEGNAGKKITIKNLVFESFVPEKPKTEVRTGAGTEYDNVIISNDVDDGSKPASLPASVVVDEHKKLRPAGTRNLGFVCDASPIDDIFMNPEKTRISPQMEDILKNLPMPLNRLVQYNDTHSWKASIGPLAARRPAKVWPWEAPHITAFGPAELLASVVKAHPEARFIWTVNVKNDSAEDAADLAEFLTGDGRTPRGLTNWAKFRIDAGAPDPIAVAAYELGNEVEWTVASNRMSVATYIERSKKIIAAIRRVDPKAVFSPHAATAPWGYSRYPGEDWKDWHRTILREIGGEIAYLAFHPYYYGYPTSLLEKYFEEIRKDILDITGSDRIKLYISEHGLWPAQKPNEPWKKTWYTTHALMGCLATAQFINRLYLRDDVGLATYHCFNAGPWGLVYRGKETKALYTTGIYDLLKIYNQAVGDNVLETKVSGEWSDPAKDDVSFSVLATDSKDGLALILVNREKTTKREVALSFKNRYRLARTVTLTAPSVHSYNDENEKRIRILDEKSDLKNVANYTVPEKSVVVLYLKKAD